MEAEAAAFNAAVHFVDECGRAERSVPIAKNGTSANAYLEEL
jgi:hypothetical protein